MHLYEIHCLHISRDDCAISLTGTTHFLLSQSDTYEAEIAVSDSMFIPNVITPNNDGLNDRLELYFNNDLPQHLVILNRWGQVIYENRQYSGSWPEEEIRSGIYYYQLRYHPPCYPSPEPLNGWLQVIGASD